MAKKALENAGYLTIGMDHFALKEDPLAQAYISKTLSRNFMGYTNLPTEDLLGLGYFSIGSSPTAYFQNHRTLDQYYAQVDRIGVGVDKVCLLSADDLKRKWVIEHLMCQFFVDKIAFKRKFKLDFDQYFHQELSALLSLEEQGLISLCNNGFKVTKLGALLIRLVAVVFDAHYVCKNKSFSQAI